MVRVSMCACSLCLQKYSKIIKRSHSPPKLLAPQLLSAYKSLASFNFTVNFKITVGANVHLLHHSITYLLFELQMLTHSFIKPKWKSPNSKFYRCKVQQQLAGSIAFMSGCYIAWIKYIHKITKSHKMLISAFIAPLGYINNPISRYSWVVSRSHPVITLLECVLAITHNEHEHNVSIAQTLVDTYALVCLFVCKYVGTLCNYRDIKPTGVVLNVRITDRP